jgi:tetratricopeptide (TPR) repeat protein
VLEVNAGTSDQTEDTSLISKLLDGTPETIEQQNQEISQALESDFTNPQLHEKAALLLGAFTLREHSGNFYEIRSPLSRITAHLAMAQFLGGTNAFGINGQMAEALMLTMVGDQAPALEQLSNMNTNDAPVAAMVRALRARNTGDYRPLGEATDRTPFESVQWFFTMADFAGTPAAWPKLSDEQKHTVDFVRIANEVGYSVEIGHDLLDVSVPLEMQEIKSIYELSHPGQSIPSDIATVLNVFPEDCFSAEDGGRVRVDVIGWGQWAMFFQRQLCHAVQQNFYLMNSMWGLPDDAKEFAARCDQSFGALTLYPFVRRFDCTDVDSFHKAVDDGFKLTVSMPQFVPATCWNYLCYDVPFAPRYVPVPNPHVNEWHNHNPLPGTVYNLPPRLYHPSLTGRGDAVACFERLHDLAPYNERIMDFILKHKYDGHPTFDQAMALYHEVTPYSAGALCAVASSVYDQPAQYEELMVRAGGLDPVNYYFLGDYEFKRKEEDKAAQYYEKAYDADPDRVRASNRAEWLVRYLLKHKRNERASEIASEAGMVYSSRGLETQAVYYEETSNYDSAFEWFAKIEERYNDSTPVLDFCLRHKAETGDPRFDSEVQKRMGKLFPKGMEKVSINDFKDSPIDGVLLNGESQLMDSAGLRKGDVVVALDGVWVHNTTQYGYIRDSTGSAELDLIVWQGGAYRESKSSPPNRKFGVDIVNYYPPRQ